MNGKSEGSAYIKRYAPARIGMHSDAHSKRYAEGASGAYKNSNIENIFVEPID